MVGYEVSDLGPRLRFDVYDASIFQGAHWLLPKREESQGMNMTAHEWDLQYAWIVVVLGGERWKLPANTTDIQRLSTFLQSMSTYRTLTSVDDVFQTVSIIAIILRLLALASAIPRVSIITRTLKGCIQPLLYFLLPFAVILVQFAAMGTICFGRRIQSLSSLTKSLETVLEFIFFGGGGAFFCWEKHTFQFLYCCRLDY